MFEIVFCIKITIQGNKSDNADDKEDHGEQKSERDGSDFSRRRIFHGHSALFQIINELFRCIFEKYRITLNNSAVSLKLLF